MAQEAVRALSERCGLSPVEFSHRFMNSCSLEVISVLGTEKKAEKLRT